jgi:hypothetical protein
MDFFSKQESVEMLSLLLPGKLEVGQNNRRLIASKKRNNQKRQKL